MKQNAVPAGSGRPGGADRAIRAILPVVTALLATPALAGDRAGIDYIGFSPDARYFAFEEFGIQDGSGFAYASIYVVDLERDDWVVGTPIRVQADEDAQSLAEIRASAAQQAAEPIADLEINMPVDVIALIGDGAPAQDGKSLAFGLPGYWAGDVIGENVLTLDTFTTSAASPCMDWFSKEPLGFTLDISTGESTLPIHRDDALPRSRGCPFDYRIHGVVMPFMEQTLDNAVAIISVYPGGFEGPDRRFLAVPLAP